MTTPDILDDFANYVDWLNPATLTIRGSGVTYAITHAHRNQVPISEHTPAGGDLRQGDTIWQFPISETCDPIPLGSTLQLNPSVSSSGISDSELWTILSITKQIWSSKWEAQCRNLSLAANLNLTVSYEVAGYTKDAYGELQPSWTVLDSDLPAKIQLERTTNTIENAADDIDTLYQITLATSLALLPGMSYRFRDSSNNVYLVESYHSPNRIDELPYILARLSSAYGSSSGA